MPGWGTSVVPAAHDAEHGVGGRPARCLVARPRQWLVLSHPAPGADIVGELGAALEGSHRSIVDVSANRIALELSGPLAKEVLSKGCAVDLHPRAWRPGMCARAMLARAQVILHERSDSTGDPRPAVVRRLPGRLAIRRLRGPDAATS